MPPYGEPDWATPGDTSNTAATTQDAGPFAPPVSASTTTNGNSGESRGKARLFLTVLSFVNIGLAAMMGALGVLTLIQFGGGKFSVPFLASYMVLFAGILFMYELCWWQPFPKINKIYRRNFGFMYGLMGKGLYLIFIAFLCLGLRNEAKSESVVKFLNWASGLGWLADGIFHVFVAMSWPEISQQYKPPTAGLTTAEESGSNPV